MAVSLAKGGNVSLTKEAPGPAHDAVGLGWDARTTTGADFDLDASASCSARPGKILSDDATSSSSTTSPAPTARSSTPATTSPARARATTRSIKVDLAKRRRRRRQDRLPGVDLRRRQPAADLRPGPQRLHPGRQPGDGGTELARYDLSEDASTETAMIFGELYRHGGEWKFRAVGQGYAGGLARSPALRRQRLTRRGRGHG